MAGQPPTEADLDARAPAVDPIRVAGGVGCEVRRVRRAHRDAQRIGEVVERVLEEGHRRLDGLGQRGLDPDARLYGPLEPSCEALLEAGHRQDEARRLRGEREGRDEAHALGKGEAGRHAGIDGQRDRPLRREEVEPDPGRHLEARADANDGLGVGPRREVVAPLEGQGHVAAKQPAAGPSSLALRTSSSMSEPGAQEHRGVGAGAEAQDKVGPRARMSVGDFFF